MKPSQFGRCALGCAALALLAGCGAPGSMPQPPAIAAHADRGKSWMAKDARGNDLLYVVNDTTVDVFSYPQGALEGQLTGLSHPFADCTDRHANVYISDFATGAIAEYAHGGTEPIRTIWPPSPGVALYSCAVDPKSGDLAVTSYGNEKGFDAYLAVYPNAMGPPKVYTDSDFVYYGYCAYDNAGNLFVDGTYPHSYNNAILAELPRGGASLTTMSLDYALGWIAGVQWDGEYLAVGQAVTPQIFRYRISGSSGTFVGSTNLSSAYFLSQFIINGKHTIVANLYYYDRYIAKWDALVFDYPTGGGATAEILNSGEPITSVALSRQRQVTAP
jgi:hypothetical protein